MSAIIFYKIVYLLTALAGFIMAIIVIHGNWKDKFSRLYALVNIGLVIWATGRYLMLVATNQSEALLGAHILYFGSFAIYLFFLHSIIVFLNIEKHRRAILTLFYTIAVVLVVSNSTDIILGTKFFIADVSAKSIFAYYETPGQIYFLQLFSNIFIPIYAFFELIRRYKSTSFEKQFQSKYILASSIIGFVGGSTILALVYDIPVQPIGIPLVAIQFGIITYAIVYHRLFNLKVLLTELLVFTLWIFILVRTIITENSTEQLVNSGLLLLTIIFGLILIRSVQNEVKQREKIEKLAKDLELANKKQEDLLHIMNHDVKKPLSRDVGIFDSILGGSYGYQPPPMKHLVEEGLKLTRADTQKIIDFLNDANLKTGEVKYASVPFDLRRVVESAVQSMKKELMDANVELKTQIENDNTYLVKGDEDKFSSHVIGNLLKNLTTYARGKSATLSLTDGNGRILLKLKDTGVGITPNDMKNLFTKGGKGEQATQINKESTGEGLYDAKMTTEAHGGKIWAESEGAGKGSIFFVELPAS